MPSGLSGLVFADRPLTETLTHVALLAVEAVPGADGVGLTAIEPGRALVTVASMDFVAAVDTVQYDLGEGPCIEAAAVGRTRVSGSLGGDARWPRFGPRAGRLGVHSVLSLPLTVGDRRLGSLNMYGHRRDAFSAEAVAIGEQFSAQASATVANAMVLEQARALTRRLETALGSRTVIDQAIGVLMARNGSTAEEAFEVLKTISATEGTKLAEIAQTLVTLAVARARARRTAP
jgi:GAF domain-containing protein